MSGAARDAAPPRRQLARQREVQAEGLQLGDRLWAFGPGLGLELCDEVVARRHDLSMGYSPYGDVTYIERDILEWPERWQRIAGLTPESVALQGRTHTIAELMATDPAQPVEATVLARVVSLAGDSKGSTVRVTTGRASWSWTARSRPNCSAR